MNIAAKKKQKRIPLYLKALSKHFAFSWIWALGLIGGLFVMLSIVAAAWFSVGEPDTNHTGIAQIAAQSDATSFQQYQIADENILGLDLVRINNSGDAVITGHAPASARVIIELNGNAIGAVQTDNHGEWVFLTPSPLPTGHHRLTLEAISEDSTTKIYGDQSLVIIVPQKSVVLQGGEENSSETLVVLLPNDAESGSRVLRSQFAANKTPLGWHFTVDSIDYSNHGLLIIGGSLQAESIEMILYLDNRPIARKRFTGKGAVPVNWDVQVNGRIPAGHYQLRVDMVKDDKVILRRILPLGWDDLRDDISEPDTQDNEYFIVQPGNSLWYIARNVLGIGAKHTVLYDANRQKIHDPNQIYPGQILIIPNQKQEKQDQTQDDTQKKPAESTEQEKESQP